ncbi:MAG: cysteine biosynthesis protein CysZ [Alphaproteobacteria bacterium]|nr:cysteine biosynthesis protein CysZ [Alphaproteobacteria bacterium]
MISDRAFMGVVLKSVALTLVLFVLLFVGLQMGLSQLPTLHWQWVNVAVDFLASIGLAIALFFLGAPVAALFASLFLDDIAEAVERHDYPADPPSRGVPFFTGLWAGLKLAFWVILVDLLLLPVAVFLPIVGPLVTVMVNGWLLGREYFELATLRHLPPDSANRLRGKKWWRVWGGGIVIATLAMIPGASLVAPLFGAALMVHVFKRMAHEEQAA